MSKIEVSVRIRPLTSTEYATTPEDYREAIRPFGPNVALFNPRSRRLKGHSTKDEKRFCFNHVFPQSATQLDVFEKCVRPAVKDIVQGINVSVLLYGPTGSGKTYTMLGTDHTAPGIIPQTVDELYRTLRGEAFEATVHMSFVEIYNEQVRDLLSSNTKPIALDVCESAEGQTVIKDLSTHVPSNIGEFLYLLSKGNSNRFSAATAANENSSRSHAILQLSVETVHTISSSDGTTGAPIVRYSKLTMVDLAGSERASATQNRGKRMEEGAKINQSLLALGNVITALSLGNDSQYVNYRGSRLTRLLRDCIGGNCRTVLIAAVSPSSLTAEDTHNTLQYATRATKINVQACVNEKVVKVHISEYEGIISKLRAENESLRLALVNTEKALSEQTSAKMVSSQEHDEELWGKYNTLSTEMDRLWRELADCDEAKELELSARLRGVGHKVMQWTEQCVKEGTSGGGVEPVSVVTAKHEWAELEKRLKALPDRRKRITSQLEQIRLRRTEAFETTNSGDALPTSCRRIASLMADALAARSGRLEDQQLASVFHNKNFLTCVRLDEAHRAIAKFRDGVASLENTTGASGKFRVADAWAAVSCADSLHVTAHFTAALESVERVSSPHRKSVHLDFTETPKHPASSTNIPRRAACEPKVQGGLSHQQRPQATPAQNAARIIQSAASRILQSATFATPTTKKQNPLVNQPSCLRKGSHNILSTATPKKTQTPGKPAWVGVFQDPKKMYPPAQSRSATPVNEFNGGMRSQRAGFGAENIGIEPQSRSATPVNEFKGGMRSQRAGFGAENIGIHPQSRSATPVNEFKGGMRSQQENIGRK